MSSMDLPYRNFIGSSPFRFDVGPHKRQFYVHSDLVAQCSPSLAVLVNGRMIEAQARYAILEDIGEDTIIRFIEHLYTNEYTVPEPDIVLMSSDIGNGIGSENAAVEVETEHLKLYNRVADLPQEAVEPALAEPPVEVEWVLRSREVKKKSKKPKANLGCEEFPKAPPEVPHHENRWRHVGIEKERFWSVFQKKASIRRVESWEPRKNKEAGEDYTKVFLCHVELYIFSDKYGIESLRELTLQKLRLTLSRFTLFDQRISDVIELMEYTYANTMEYEGGIDRLRSLVMDYVVCHIERIAKRNDFQQILQREGALAKDLVMKLLWRLD